MSAKYIVPFFVLISLITCHAIDLNYTDIYTVTDETRFTHINPDVKLVPFNKAHHVKGNFIFEIGERIKGDKLILTFLDKQQFARPEDIEVFIKYPARGKNGNTITAIQYLVDLTSDDADAFITDGGIDHTFVDVLLVCNQTKSFTYELFYYGY